LNCADTGMNTSTTTAIAPASIAKYTPGVMYW
jgi:hypothetical protein